MNLMIVITKRRVSFVVIIMINDGFNNDKNNNKHI